jgi:hypothetical protein
MDHNQNGYPENWKEMTPDQKRQWRLNRFASGEGIQFVSAEAKQAYNKRARRFVDAFNLELPEQVPIVLPVGDLPYLLFGIDLHTAMYDTGKAVDACKDFNQKYAVELDYFANPARLMPAKALEILDYKLYSWPGHGLAEDAPGYQFLEGEYMKQDEYSELILDPTDFWLRTYLPRVFGAFEPFSLLQPLTGIYEVPMGKLEVLAKPEFKAALRKLLEVSEDMEKRTPLIDEYTARGPAAGYVGNPRSGPAKAPFDILGDTLRGTTNIMKDIYRRPDRILEALDVLANVTISNILNAPNASRLVSVSFPLHKGADGWMSQKQFDTFYFPTLKKVMDAIINQGVIVTLFAEGSFNTRLESVNVFPKGSVCWYFDQTDMFRAKRILGDKCSIQGNLPSSLLVTGSADEVKNYCKKLIEGCGQGGGYILAAGAIVEKPRLENLQAMVAAVKEYGTYRK